MYNQGHNNTGTINISVCRVHLWWYMYFTLYLGTVIHGSLLSGTTSGGIWLYNIIL